MSIEVVEVVKRYGAHTALRGVSLRIEAGELVALLGPSGSGKTTLLRVLAGLEAPDSGRVIFDGRDVTSGSARDRGVGFVFQHYALFREMSVLENVAFGMRVKPRRERPSEARIRRRALELLELVHLDGLASRRPSELSGGQRQRVALARALAVDPRVLLLDEPFGALDAEVRRQLRAFLRDLHERVGITTVLVTHDRDEALEVADRIVLVNEGAIEQVGTPTELHDAPRSAFVEGFLGDVNVLDARVDDGAAVAGDLRFEAPHLAPGTRARVTVRASEVELLAPDAPPNATVLRIADLGDGARVELALDGGPVLRARLERSALALGRGARVRVGARSYRVHAR
ncbi:MAG TPA: sulfate ABC transporter ATP-binding protein [Sandaracinaceae bacterium]